MESTESPIQWVLGAISRKHCEIKRITNVPDRATARRGGAQLVENILRWFHFFSLCFSSFLSQLSSAHEKDSEDSTTLVSVLFALGIKCEFEDCFIFILILDDNEVEKRPAENEGNVLLRNASTAACIGVL
jgi:hypothetical protein